jgi:lipopolysaccharide/colanic/teichoic acid biosynthesis glycosyltransferase
MSTEHRLTLPRNVAVDLQPRRADVIPPYDGVLGNQQWKRVVDIIVASAGLILSAPLCLIVSILIKITSPGPILFSHERVGLDRRERDRRRRHRAVNGERRRTDRRSFVKFGKPFTMYKFRTMKADAETRNPQWAVPHDPRVTRLGRVLRRTRIDEIPQFLNVILGDMSVVGPRPERPFFMVAHDREVPDFKRRLRTKPGITGLAQVNAGYTNSVAGMKRKLGFDLEYIRRISLFTDLKILLQTVLVVVTGKGAF